jgi:hypothetical protein
VGSVGGGPNGDATGVGGRGIEGKRNEGADTWTGGNGGRRKIFRLPARALLGDERKARASGDGSAGDSDWQDDSANDFGESNDADEMPDGSVASGRGWNGDAIWHVFGGELEWSAMGSDRPVPALGPGAQDVRLLGGMRCVPDVGGGKTSSSLLPFCENWTSPSWNRAEAPAGSDRASAAECKIGDFSAGDGEGKIASGCAAGSE